MDELIASVAWGGRRTNFLFDGAAAGHVPAGYLCGGLGGPPGEVQQCGAGGHLSRECSYGCTRGIRRASQEGGADRRGG